MLSYLWIDSFNMCLLFVLLLIQKMYLHFYVVTKHTRKTRIVSQDLFSNARGGPGWLNELGSWITQQFIQAYHQYGVGSRPALQITLQKRGHATR